MNDALKTAFLGLGSMGRPMAENLLKAGFQLNAWNRSRERAEPLQQLGATVAGSPAEAVQGCDVVISMLADDRATREVLLDRQSLGAMSKGCTWINMATVSLQLAREAMQACDTRGLVYVAAPVLGRPEEAAARKLHIIAAGPSEVVERLQPLLAAMGQKIWNGGEVAERANVLKIQINLALATAIESLAEASALGEAFGVPTADFVEIATSTLFACPAYQGYGGMMTTRNYQPAGFSTKLGYKDVGLALSLANDAPAPLAMAAITRDVLAEMIARGDGDKDWGAMAEVALRRVHTVNA